PAVYQEKWKADYRELTKFLDGHHRAGEPVIFCTSPRTNWGGGELLMGSTRYAASYPWPVAIIKMRPDLCFLEELQQRNCAIWIISEPGGIRAGDIFPGAPVDHYQFYPNLATCERVTPISL